MVTYGQVTAISSLIEHSVFVFLKGVDRTPSAKPSTPGEFPGAGGEMS